MNRERDQFWKHVTILNDSNNNCKWRCDFCKEEFSGNATRIKAHLAGIPRLGIAICMCVDDQVRAEAITAIKAKEVADPGISNDGPARETSITARPCLESSFDEHGEVRADVVNSSVHLNSDEAISDFRLGDERTHIAVESLLCSCNMLNENMQSLKRKFEQVSGTDVNMNETRWGKVNMIKIGEYNYGMEQAVKKGLEEFLALGRIPIEPTFLEYTEQAPFATTKLVGEDFQKKVDEIFEDLMKEEVWSIGIYGMGGVGKTAILMDVHNRLLHCATFTEVIWVSAPHPFNIYDLQKQIARSINLEHLLEKEEDVRKRAAILFRSLMAKTKSVLILDGLWKHFELGHAGIPPLGINGFKMVVSTRSLIVCSRMFCQKQIKVQPLCQEEAWSLFLEKLGFATELPSSKIEETAKFIVSECEGLPLALTDVATKMRGMTNVYEWRAMLQKLEESNLEPEVFQTLELSYGNLDDHQVKQCFLRLALHPKYARFGIREVIECFVDEGLIIGMGRRERLNEQSHTVIKKLVNSSLLEEVPEESMVRMHRLVRHMALTIMSATSMVKAGMELKEVPDEEFWTSRLEVVSLMENKISETPPDISPACPNLKVLLLNGNMSLKVISEAFLEKLQLLTVLNLSKTRIKELPNSISNLVNLNALLLLHCRELLHIPCLGKLRLLKKLDVFQCNKLKDIPKGLEVLAKMRYLDVHGTAINRLPGGMLEKLVELQYLFVDALNVKAEEIVKLERLEILHCSFLTVDDFNRVVEMISQRENDINELPQYQLTIGEMIDVQDDYFVPGTRKKVFVSNWPSITYFNENSVTFPVGVEGLKVTKCSNMITLTGTVALDCLQQLAIEQCDNLQVICGVPNGNVTADCTIIPSQLYLNELRFSCLYAMRISDCPKLKLLFGLEAKFNLPKLQEIHISDCNQLEAIAGVASLSQFPSSAFPSLEKIEVNNCPNMQRLVEAEFMPHLQNVKKIMLCACGKMEEVATILPSCMSSGSTFSLSSIEISKCHNLIKLFSVETLLFLPHLQNISVDNCRRIEEIISQGNERSSPSISSTTSAPFSKLKGLIVRDLPQLRSICSGTCDSIESITISKCPNLKRIPLHLPILADGLHHPPPSLKEIRISDLDVHWWDSLEWGHPHASGQLHPFLNSNL